MLCYGDLLEILLSYGFVLCQLRLQTVFGSSKRAVGDVPKEEMFTKQVEIILHMLNHTYFEFCFLKCIILFSSPTLSFCELFFSLGLNSAVSFCLAQVLVWHLFVYEVHYKGILSGSFGLRL